MVVIDEYLAVRVLGGSWPEGLPDDEFVLPASRHVIESWNRVNAVIFYGKTGEFATNLRDQELGIIALHLLQASMVHVNTLMVQEVLALPEWKGVLTPEDRRGLTPLFWGHILPYGEVMLDMAHRLALSAPPEPDPGESAAGDLG